MEIKKATIDRTDSVTSLVLDFGKTPLNIILTDDNPNNIKSVFNSLLKALKNGVFEFKLEDEKQDLYHDICVEYIVQLNVEMKAVHKELTDYGLIVKEEEMPKIG